MIDVAVMDFHELRKVVKQFFGDAPIWIYRTCKKGIRIKNVTGLYIILRCIGNKKSQEAKQSDKIVLKSCARVQVVNQEYWQNEDARYFEERRRQAEQTHQENIFLF